MSEKLSEAAFDQLFRTARTYNAWLPKEVTDEQLKHIYELAKFGPTSANSSPMRPACDPRPARRPRSVARNRRKG